MPDLPADAVDAAHEAVYAGVDDVAKDFADEIAKHGTVTAKTIRLALRLAADTALEAAAPALRAQGAADEREACAQLAEQHDAQVPAWREGQTITEVFLSPGGITTWHPFADLIRTRKEAAHGPHRDEQ